MDSTINLISDRLHFGLTKQKTEGIGMDNGKRLRLGLSGCGSFSIVVASAVKRSNKAELITCFDVLPESRKKCSERFGCDQEKSFESLINRQDIDAVLLVVPNAFHAEQAVMAAEHGKHVYVEKPIANTIADGRRIIEACQKAGVTLMVGHYRRRNAGNRKLKELISQGVIGKPIMVEANDSSGLGFELTPDKFRWRGDDTGCPAGSLMTIGIHTVDVFNYLFGPIKTVFSFFNKLYIPAEVEDVTTTVCQFESGILGYLGSNYASPRTDWMYIYGTGANLLMTTYLLDMPVDQRHESTARTPAATKLVVFEKGKEARDIPLNPADPYLEEIDEFVRCVRSGDRPETDGPGALANLAFIRAAIDSARTGLPVKLKV